MAAVGPGVGRVVGEPEEKPVGIELVGAAVGDDPTGEEVGTRVGAEVGAAVGTAIVGNAVGVPQSRLEVPVA